jgi:hypothetical protein
MWTSSHQGMNSMLQVSLRANDFTLLELPEGREIFLAEYFVACSLRCESLRFLHCE